MSIISEMKFNASQIHARLMSPPNAVVDNGINLRPAKPQPEKRAPRGPRLSFHAKRKAEILAVAQIVAEFYDLKVDTVLSFSRKGYGPRARWVTCYLSHDLLEHTHADIGDVLNRRGDHAFSLRAIRKVTRLMASDTMLSGEIKKLEDLILDRWL